MLKMKDSTLQLLLFFPAQYDDFKAPFEGNLGMVAVPKLLTQKKRPV